MQKALRFSVKWVLANHLIDIWLDSQAKFNKIATISQAISLLSSDFRSAPNHK
jgi:hypothetical protein